MSELVMVITTAAVFVFGYFRIRKLDDYLKKNVHRDRRS